MRVFHSCLSEESYTAIEDPKSLFVRSGARELSRCYFYWKSSVWTNNDVITNNNDPPVKSCIARLVFKVITK